MPKSMTKQSHADNIIQFSVFVENKVGRLLELVNLFQQYNIHVVAVSIVDTTDSAINRMIVDDAKKAREVFDENGYSYSECELIVVEMDMPEVDLQKVLSALVQAECNIYFVYSLLSQPNGKAALALHVDDNELACDVLTRSGFKILSQNDILR
ncbi:MAG: acetolactate synthase [Verrucomicrobiota bacterium]|nr:acetolactate synthase [Verrucomicrobiota bacterium]